MNAWLVVKTDSVGVWLRRGVALVGAATAVVACGGSKEQTILPGPSVGDLGGSSAGGATTAGGAGAGGTGGAAGMAVCTVYAPDRCPESPGADKQLCVSLQTDAANCGACGTACEAQAICTSGKCGAPPQELTKASQCGDVRLALLGSQLFWTEQQSGRVRALPVNGGAVTEVASNQLAPGRIAVDNQGVYWVATGDGSSGSSKVMKAALPLGDAPSALKTAPGTDPIIGVAVDAGKLYYGLVHDIHAISTDPTDPTDVVVGVSFVTTNDVRTPDGVPEGLTVHAGRVYWVISDVGSVESDDLLPGPDGTPRVGHSGQMWPNDLGFAGDYVYYAAFFSLYAAQTNLPAVAVASSDDDANLASFAVSGTTGYFADVGGHLWRHDLALPAAPDFQPTPSAALARDQGKITSVVLDDTHVYWASVDASGDCAIRALAL